MEEQVISKERVADHGEVLTAKREVEAMLDLVKQETERIESRFLEPAKDDYKLKPVADYSPVHFFELGLSANERELVMGDEVYAIVGAAIPIGVYLRPFAVDKAEGDRE